MITIKLERKDELTCAAIAFRREAESPTKVDRSVQKVTFHESIYRNAEAIGSEMAVAVYFGIPNFEPTVNTFKMKADVGRSVEIKWTRYQHGHLIIKPSDRDEDVAILVTGASPHYELRGWMSIKRAKTNRYLTLDGSWWVPQLDLLPLDDLVRSDYASALL